MERGMRGRLFPICPYTYTCLVIELNRTTITPCRPRALSQDLTRELIVDAEANEIGRIEVGHATKSRETRSVRLKFTLECQAVVISRRLRVLLHENMNMHEMDVSYCKTISNPRTPS